jgi:prepilin-type N-terminal cleavage/methylation domain-containing protein
MKHRKQRGDTIVEVLVAVAIISSVLGLAYATMNRNLQSIRDNQERTEASKLAQGQIELLKNAWETKSARKDIKDRDERGFCVYLDNSNKLKIRNLGNDLPNDDVQDDDFDDYHDDCKSENRIYNIGVKKVTGVSSDTTYRIYVRYFKVGSDSRHDIKFVYRLADLP